MPVPKCLCPAYCPASLLKDVGGPVGYGRRGDIFHDRGDGGGNRFAWQPTLETGMEWIAASSLVLVMLLAAAGLLSLQFFRRRTLLARYVTGAATFLAVLTTFMPWQPAFALERPLSAVPGAASAISLKFNSSAGRFQRDPTLPALDMRDDDSVPLYLPVLVAQLPAGDFLQSDHVEIRAVEVNGQSGGHYRYDPVGRLQHAA